MDTTTMTQLYTQATAAGVTPAHALKEHLMNLERDLTIKEVAKTLAQSEAMVSRLVRGGYFPGAYKGGKGEGNAPWRIPESAVSAYRDRMRAKTSPCNRAA